MVPCRKEPRVGLPPRHSGPGPARPSIIITRSSRGEALGGTGYFARHGPLSGHPLQPLRMHLNWTTSVAAGILHAARAILAGRTLVDPPLAAAIATPARKLADALAVAGFPATQFWHHLVPAVAASPSLDFASGGSQWVAAALERAGRLAPAGSVQRLSEALVELEAAFVAARPGVAEELPLRREPLRVQWEAARPWLARRSASADHFRLARPVSDHCARAAGVGRWGAGISRRRAGHLRGPVGKSASAASGSVALGLVSRPTPGERFSQRAALGRRGLAKGRAAGPGRGGSRRGGGRRAGLGRSAPDGAGTCRLVGRGRGGRNALRLVAGLRPAATRLAGKLGPACRKVELAAGNRGPAGLGHRRSCELSSEASLFGGFRPSRAPNRSPENESFAPFCRPAVRPGGVCAGDLGLAARAEAISLPRRAGRDPGHPALGFRRRYRFDGGELRRAAGLRLGVGPLSGHPLGDGQDRFGFVHRPCQQLQLRSRTGRDAGPLSALHRLRPFGGRRAEADRPVDRHVLDRLSGFGRGDVFVGSVGNPRGAAHAVSHQHADRAGADRADVGLSGA